MPVSPPNGRATADLASTAHTRDRYDLLAPVYNLLEWPIERILYRSWREALWGQIEGPDILEIGVGTGKNVPYYPRSADVTAIDLSPGMLSRARRVVSRRTEADVTLVEMDAQSLTLPPDTFDDVVATFVFCSVPDPVLGLQEARRVARPGGHLHLLEHVRASSPIFGRLMEILDPAIHWLVGVHVARDTVENVRRAGWEILHVDSLAAGTVFKRIVAQNPD